MVMIFKPFQHLFKRGEKVKAVVHSKNIVSILEPEISKGNKYSIPHILYLRAGNQLYYLKSQKAVKVQVIEVVEPTEEGNVLIRFTEGDLKSHSKLVFAHEVFPFKKGHHLVGRLRNNQFYPKSR